MVSRVSEEKGKHLFFTHQTSSQIRQIYKGITLSTFSVHDGHLVSSDNLPLEHQALGKLKRDFSHMLLPVGAWLTIIEREYGACQLFLRSNPVFTEMSLVTQITLGNNSCKNCCQVLPFL